MLFGQVEDGLRRCSRAIRRFCHVPFSTALTVDGELPDRTDRS